MMKFALMLILPCLIVADTLCTGGEISCPKGKTCCIINAKPACCDTEIQAQLPYSSALLSVPTNSTINTSCTFNNCQGTCCSTTLDSCCPIQMATCCNGNRCCNFGSNCCGGGCCPMMAKCCESWCCQMTQRCGPTYSTCDNASVGLYPTTLVTLIAVWVTAYVVTKM